MQKFTFEANEISQHIRVFEFGFVKRILSVNLWMCAEFISHLYVRRAEFLNFALSGWNAYIGGNFSVDIYYR